MFWNITERVVKCIFYLLFFIYQRSVIVGFPNLLGGFFVDIDHYDTFQNVI